MLMMPFPRYSLCSFSMIHTATRAFMFCRFVSRQRHVLRDCEAAATNGHCQAGMLMAVWRSTAASFRQYWMAGSRVTLGAVKTRLSEAGPGMGKTFCGGHSRLVYLNFSVHVGALRVTGLTWMCSYALLRNKVTWILICLDMECLIEDRFGGAGGTMNYFDELFCP